MSRVQALEGAVDQHIGGAGCQLSTLCSVCLAACVPPMRLQHLHESMPMKVRPALLVLQARSAWLKEMQRGHTARV